MSNSSIKPRSSSRVKMMSPTAQPIIWPTAMPTAGGTELLVKEDFQRGVILSSQPGMLGNQLLRDTQVYDIVLKQFGC